LSRCFLLAPTHGAGGPVGVGRKPRPMVVNPVHGRWRAPFSSSSYPIFVQIGCKCSRDHALFDEYGVYPWPRDPSF
jgi:hypothetical protein